MTRKIMANFECCNLVGNFPIGLNGIISISAKGNTNVQLIEANGATAVTVEPSEGTVAISAYAMFECHTGCPGRASVTIPWIKRSDCSEYKYLFGGYGKSTISGDVAGLAEFPDIPEVNNPLVEYTHIEASATSGPAAQYTYDTQLDGYGLIYYGLPWTVNTTTEEGCKVNLTSYDIGDYGVCYLQSLSLTCTPGQFPVVNMDYVYSMVVENG
jgi:hypothetical protein